MTLPWTISETLTNMMIMVQSFGTLKVAHSHLLADYLLEYSPKIGFSFLLANKYSLHFAYFTDRDHLVCTGAILSCQNGPQCKSNT